MKEAMTNQKHETGAANHIVEHIDAEEYTDFSGIGNSLGESDYTSITSSVLEHVYENGRRYHSLNAGTYVIPNDENEQERLDMYHHCISLMLGGDLHIVALPAKLNRVLDLGTGTGIWAIDFADMHPEASVVGVDLSPIQPKWVPPNCTFEVDDLERPWLFKEPFDFIRSANIAQGIRDWPTYTKRIYDNLTPGGVVQLYESETWYRSDDGTLAKDGAIEHFQSLFRDASNIVGLKNVCEDLEGYLLGAGFEDVRVVVKKLPVGPWPKDPKKKELGRWFLEVCREGLKAYGLGLFTRVLGKSTEEAELICEKASNEFGRDVHIYAAQYFVEGRKPLAAEGN